MKIKSAIGIRRTTVELTDDVTTVDFGHDYKYFAIRNDGSGSIYVSTANKECTAGEDEVVLVPSGSSYVHYNGYGGNTGIYISGTGTATVVAQDDGNNPFKGAQGGGDYAVAGASSYTINNSVDYPLLGMNLYGKSTQDAVPTPNTPVDIVSVGDSGGVEVKACGKNLYEGSQDWSGAWISNSHWETADEKYLGLTVKKMSSAWTGISKLLYVEAGKTYTFSCFARADAETSATIYAVVPSDKEATALPNDCWKTITISTEWTRYNIAYNCQQSGYIKPRLEKRTTDDIYLYLCGYQLEVSNTATNYEPYKDTTANITTALPLCGIPVESDGNYTDSNGQQWVCDELIYNADGTGKIIKRTNGITFDGSENWKQGFNNAKRCFVKVENNIKPKFISGSSPSYLICNKYISGSADDTLSYTKTCMAVATDGAFLIYDKRFEGDVEGLKADMAANNLRVVYALDTLQEIALTAAEMTALRQLQTFDGVSNISNDSGADMDVKICTNKALSEFVYPITMGLQAQIDELKAAVISLGGNV